MNQQEIQDDMPVWGVSISNPFNAEANFLPRRKKAKIHEKSSEPCHIGIHWKVFDEIYQMSTQGFCHFQPFVIIFY